MIKLMRMQDIKRENVERKPQVVFRAGGLYSRSGIQGVKRPAGGLYSRSGIQGVKRPAGGL